MVISTYMTFLPLINGDFSMNLQNEITQRKRLIESNNKFQTLPDMMNSASQLQPDSLNMDL